MSLYDVVLVATTLAFVGVAGFMGWSIVRRHRGAAELVDPADRDSLGRELLWWALPTLLMLVLFALAFFGATRG